MKNDFFLDTIEKNIQDDLFGFVDIQESEYYVQRGSSCVCSIYDPCNGQIYIGECLGGAKTRPTPIPKPSSEQNSYSGSGSGSGPSSGGGSK